MKQLFFCFAGICCCLITMAQQASIRIDGSNPGALIPSTLHGIFFEEISHAGEGGLYAELIQNRGFEESRIPAGTKLENGFLVHAYKDAYWSMRNADHFDKYKRGDWDMYVGEYASNAGVGAGNMQAALADAVYILGIARNADLVKWSSYAPLLVNTNDIDWPVNLINFDAAQSFGRISSIFNKRSAHQGKGKK